MDSKRVQTGRCKRTGCRVSLSRQAVRHGLPQHAWLRGVRKTDVGGPSGSGGETKGQECW